MNALSLFNPSFATDVFDAFDRGLGVFTPLATDTSYLPRIDVRETPEAYVMDVELPGLTEKDVEINLKDRVLSISSVKDAKKEETKKENGVEYLIRERRTNSFARRFTLPEDIAADKVSANFKNGILTIDIPRRPESQPRQIEIKTA
ncbi:MAG TPA: Hsp20/alpha crystallin family protein [Treponemataceae bacterium]|nr:Hsp20/alpha crystallin family protein [Treponemataceae bacterium]